MDGIHKKERPGCSRPAQERAESPVMMKNLSEEGLLTYITMMDGPSLLENRGHSVLGALPLVPVL